MKTINIYDEETNQVLVYKEFAIGTLTAVDVCQALSSITHYPVIIESGIPSSDEAHFSYIGVGECSHYVTDPNSAIDPFDQLQTKVDGRTRFNARLNIPLAGTLVGFIAYDAACYSLRMADSGKSKTPAIYLMEHRVALTIDHHKKQGYLSTIASDKQEAASVLEMVFELLNQRPLKEQQEGDAFPDSSEIEVDISDEEFCRRVIQAKEYIRKGDAFQIVLSRKFQTKVSASPFEVYRSIRENCLSPYKFFIQTEDFAICGASPERLVKIADGTIENMPIAGTRPRTHGIEDEAAAQSLIDDEKEHAEHMMLVDLARNDIGRVAKPGSVEVKELKQIYLYTHVMHLVSRVRGILNEGTSGIEALKASFPAGTLSGAPKIRAMQIIDELEKSPRGIYGGAICTIDHSNRIDSFIAIRMALIKDNIATVQTGAGIVIDSVPKLEADETRHKASSILNAIKFAKGVAA